MKHKFKRIYKTVALTLLTSTIATFPLAQASNDNQVPEQQNYVFGTFFTSNEDIKTQCYLSKDGINLRPFRTIDEIAGRDTSCQYYKGYFYICLVEPQIDENKNKDNTFKLYKSNDLKEWEVVSFKVIDRGEKYPKVWAPDLFINDDGSAYVYFAKQKGLISKPYEAKFDLYVYKIDNIANIDKFVKVLNNDEINESVVLAGTGRIDKTKEDVKTINGEATPVFDKSISEGTNYIDAQVRKVNGKYYMVIKNEARTTNNDNKSPKLFSSNRPDGGFTEVDDWPLKGIRGYEGFSILNRDKKVYFYADNFSLKYDQVSKSGHTVWIANEKEIEDGPYKAYQVNSEERTLRHGSVINLDSSALNASDIENAFKDDDTSKNPESTDVKPKEVTLTKEDFGRNGERDKKIKNTVIIDDFAPAPNVVYIVPSKTKVVIDSVVNPYGVEEIQFKFNKDSKLKIGQEYIKDKQEYIKDKVVPIDEAINLTKANKNADNSNESVNSTNDDVNNTNDNIDNSNNDVNNTNDNIDNSNNDVNNSNDNVNETNE